MILRLTNNEVDLMKEALDAYARSLQAKARPMCAGYSADAITLCCRRLEAEALAADLLNRQPRLFAVEHSAKAHTVMHAAEAA